MSKKILAILMAVAMAFSLLPVTALAGNPSLLSITPPDEGNFATYEFYTSEEEQSPYYTQTVKTDDTLNRPADPTLAGSHFTGWKTADGAEVPFGKVTVTKTSTIKCFAQWEENKNPIHVYFMAAIGSNEVMHTGVAQNGIVAIPEDYKDITWKTADGKAFDGKNVTNDMNVYPASASCWLTFDSQGGSAIASHYVQQGESFELGKVGNPEKAGYTFAGWSLTTDGASVTQVTPTKDTKLYALWTPATAKYTVIHWQENANDDGYSYIASEEKSGITDGKTSAVANSYQGFTATAIEQQTINGDSSTIVNVYYQRNSYTIYFYYKDKGKWKEYTDIRITAKYGADISSQWPEKKNSKTWSTTKDLSWLNGGPYQVNIETMPLGGAKYYGPKTDRGSESAHYYVEVIPGESGTVTRGDVTYKLHHTDTSPGTGYKVSKEDKYPLTGFKYKEGTDNGANYDNAEFYYTRNSYDVVYVNGAEVKKEPYRYEQDISGAGSSYTPTAPTGYTFGGWCSDPSGTRPYDFYGKKMPAQSITVYAKWVPITLKLTIQGVDGVGSADVNYKQVINEAGVYTDATAKLAAENKTVLYWVNCETNQKEDVNRQMTTNLTIRPVLKGDTYTVTYTSGANDSQLYWYNTIAKVKNYTGEKADKFLYWTDAANTNTKYYPGAEIRMTANVTLKPHFSEGNPVQQTYSVTYYSNFGTDQEHMSKESIKNNALFTIKTYEDTQLPDREGYEFKEWNTKSDGTGQKFEANSPARMDGANGNDLYAQWQRCTYTLTYNANGGRFGSEDSAPTTKQETSIPTGKYSLKYSPEYTPTHAQSGDKDVIFLGWSIVKKENVLTKADVNDATTIASNIITEVNIPAVQTVYAVWSLDENENNFPDVFEATVTYKIENGTWADGKAEHKEVIKVKELKNGVWTDTGNKLTKVPSTKASEVKPSSGFTATGTWDTNPDTNTPVTANKKYTYTLSPVTTGTLTITKKVEGDGLTVDRLPENFQITVKDAQDNIKGTLTKTEEAKKADDTLTWTISGLPAGEYTVSETGETLENYTCEATYHAGTASDATATVNNANTTQNQPATDVQASRKVTVREKQTSTMTVTNKYTKKAEPPTPTDPVEWDVSRSKTASGLTKNSNGEWTTDVTLGLPSATTKQTIDVVLVVDNAFPTDNTTAATQAAGLMEQLEKIAKSGTVSINTGLVISGGYIPVLHRIALGNIENNITNIKEAIDKSKTDWKQQEGRKGSNIQAGVETARQMLAGETSASKENKYLVLISDGGAFSWYENGTSVSKFYSTETDPEKPNYYWCNPWDFQKRYGDGPSSQQFDFAALMKKPETEVDANSIPCPSKEWPSTGNGKNGEGNQTQYQSNYSKATVQSTLDKYPGKCAYSIVSKKGYITSREAALYHTAKSISMASNEVKVIFVSFPYYNNGSNLFKLTEGFKQYVADNNDNVTLYRVNGRENYPDEYQARDSIEVFKSVKKDLIYLVDKGSKVEDTIGNKFTLIPDSFKLTVGGTELQSIKDGETYYFGDKTVSTTAYKFKVTVTKTGSETKFNWDINEAITKDKPVKLSYKLKLTTPQTAAGTYGVADLYGDGIVDDTGAAFTDTDKKNALYTNESATLLPVNSAGKPGQPLLFPKPSVSYTVSSGSSGSHSGGSRPSLNTKDHYGYIIGYPVDYYTGQPTTDQTKKPVRPEGKITRAEVATIYFRMLTDESRTKFWSQSSGYSDVKAGDWFNNAVSTLSNAGIIAGYEDGSFRPNGYITRAEFATIAARFFDVTYNGKDLFPDISGHWAKDYINQAANKGFVNGYEDGTFKPDRNITRAEAVTLVNRTLDRHPDKSHFTKDMLVWPDNMDQTKWYYADMQEATNSHTYQMKENSDKTKYENWTKTLPIRNWEALEKAWSNANSSQGNGNVV